jgi:hypothetical protein
MQLRHNVVADCHEGRAWKRDTGDPFCPRYAAWIEQRNLHYPISAGPNLKNGMWQSQSALHFARASSRPGPRVSRGHLKEPGSLSQKTSLPCLHRDLGGVIHGFYSLFLPIEDPLMCGKSSISPYGRSRLPSYGLVGDSVKAALSGPIYRLGRPTLNGSFLDFRNSRVFEPTRSSRPNWGQLTISFA